MPIPTERNRRSPRFSRICLNYIHILLCPVPIELLFGLEQWRLLARLVCARCSLCTSRKRWLGAVHYVPWEESLGWRWKVYASRPRSFARQQGHREHWKANVISQSLVDIMKHVKHRFKRHVNCTDSNKICRRKSGDFPLGIFQGNSLTGSLKLIEALMAPYSICSFFFVLLLQRIVWNYNTA